MSTHHPVAVSLTNQWNDFLLRELDPYAMAKYDLLLKWLGPIRGKKCIVVGSGSGEFAALLARNGADVLAVDIDASSVQLTEETAERFGVKLKTKVSHLEMLNSDEKFDIVAATDVIEHIADDVAAAAQLGKLLKPDGTLLVTVPALQILFGYHDEVLGHFRRYNNRTLSHLFGPQFEFLRIQYFGFFLIPIALIISRWLRRPYPVAKAGKAEKNQSFFGLCVKCIFFLEKKLRFPIGTSLLFLGKPKNRSKVNPT